jgi:hypothetical protein
MTKKGDKRPKEEKQLQADEEKLEAEVFYCHPTVVGRMTTASKQLRSQYDTLRMSKPQSHQSIMLWLIKLGQLKYKILELEQ